MAQTVGIDAAGRVVVPRELRRQLGVHGPCRLEIRHMGDHIELRVAATAIAGRTGDDGLPILESEEPLPPMTDEDVRNALEQSRR